MRKTKLSLVKGDIIEVECDAIVNSANPSLIRGSGLNGIIHRKSGNRLESECQAIGKCPVGEVRLTRAYKLEDLQTYWILHAVGPRWLGGEKNEAILLRSAYQKSLEVATNYGEVYYEQMKSILGRYFVGKQLEEELGLVRDYIHAHPILTVAFPAISTGVYHYPLEDAVQIAVETIKDFISQHTVLEEIKIVCYEEQTYKQFHKCLNEA